MTPDTDVRIELKFKNARLYNAIRDAAFKDKDYNRSFDRGRVSAFCRFYSLNYPAVSELLTLKASPIHGKTQTYRRICVQLSSILGIDCETLFPSELYAQTWPRGVAADVPLVKFVALSAARRIALPDADYDVVEQRELRELMASVVGTLTPQEAIVITRRFGLDGDDEHTMKEVGQELGVSNARIQQIESKAIRKLRHPARSRDLRSFRSW